MSDNLRSLAIAAISESGNRSPRLAALLLKLAACAACESSTLPPSGPMTPLPTTSFVAPGGNDATAIRGQIESPFLTPGAAITASLSGDAIYVSPGNYAQPIDIGVLNPALTALTIFGSNEQTTTLGSITWTASPSVTFLELAALSLIATTPLSIDGSAAIMTVKLSAVTLASFGFGLLTAGLLQSVTTVFIDRLTALGRFEIKDSTDIFLGGDSVLQTGLILDFSATSTNQRGTYTLKECTIFGARFGFIGPPTIVPGLYLTGHPVLYADPSVRIVGLPAVPPSEFQPGLPEVPSVDSALDTVAVPNLAPNIRIEALCDNAVHLNFSPTQGTSPTFATNLADLSRGQFLSAVTATVNAPDPNQNTQIIARVADFEKTVNAGQSVSLDIRSSFYEQANLSSGPGSAIDRDEHTFMATVLAGGAPQVFPFSPPSPPFPPSATFNYISNVVSGAIQAFMTVGSDVDVTLSPATAGASGVEITIVRS